MTPMQLYKLLEYQKNLSVYRNLEAYWQILLSARVLQCF